MNENDRHARVTAYMDKHVSIIMTALEVYEEHMRDAALDTATARAVAAQDKTADKTTAEKTVDITPTTRGFAAMTQLFGQMADRARNAMDDWPVMTDIEETP